jgi:hypothetical protein
MIPHSMPLPLLVAVVVGGIQSLQASTAVVAAAEAAAAEHSFPRLNHLAAREPPDKVITVAAAILEMAPCRLILAAAAVVVVQALLATQPAEQTQLQTVAAVVQDPHTQSLELQPRMAEAVAVVVQVPEDRHPEVAVAVEEERIKRTAQHRKQGLQILAAVEVALVVFLPLPPPSEIPAEAVL